jgi:hypothetical protein
MSPDPRIASSTGTKLGVRMAKDVDSSHTTAQRTNQLCRFEGIKNLEEVRSVKCPVSEYK